jgi:pimeloyl-ACP methyl ester carboxylesterase
MSEKLFSSTTGEGYPLIFLHGFLESSTMWDYLSLDELNCQKIFIDLPGHGKSPLCEVLPPSIETMAILVVELINSLNIEKCTVVGHSMGGYVALEVKNRLESVDKVVLLNSNCWTDTENKKADRRRVANIVYHSKSLFIKEAIPNLFIEPDKYSEQVAKLVYEALNMSADGIAYASLAMSERRDFSGLLKSNPDEFVVIQGVLDNIVPKALSDDCYSGIPIQYYLLEGVGHMAHIESPTQVLQILKSCI